MSGLLSRLKAIFQAQANSVVEQIEDPKASLDYSLRRLEENRRALSQSLVDVAAARKRLERQRDELVATIDKYEQQARDAVEADREDLARLALERKRDVEARLAELDSNITRLHDQLESLKQSQSDLDNKIATFRSRKEELKSVYDASQAQIRVREALSGVSEDLADVGNTIGRAEARIEEMQARADAIDALVAEGVLVDVLQPEGDDIDRDLARIGRSQAVETELERLKADARHEIGERT